MISLMVAAGLSVLRADRLRLGAAFALAISSVLFFGSHNITILLGLSTLALAGLATAVCVPYARRQITRRGLVRVAGVVVPAVLVNGWYLVPLLAYGARTRIGDKASENPASLRDTAGLVSLGHLFSFSRSGLPGPLPVLAIAWVLAGVLVLWRRGDSDRAWRRLLLAFSGVAVLIAIAMTHVGVLLALPRPYRLIQFSYRLEVYVVIMLCGAIVAALALAQRDSRRARVWRWMAIPICVVSLVATVQQLANFPYPGLDRYETLEFYGQVNTGDNEDFQDTSTRVIPAANLQTLVFPLSGVHDERVSASLSVPPGTLVATNIAAGSYLLSVTGAKPVGVDSKTDLLVLQVGSPRADSAAASAATASEETITVSTGHSLPIVLGRALTFLGLAMFGVGLLALVVRRLRPAGLPIVAGAGIAGRGRLPVQARDPSAGP
jgi:hypothetical protein